MAIRPLAWRQRNDAPSAGWRTDGGRRDGDRWDGGRRHGDCWDGGRRDRNRWEQVAGMEVIAM